MLWGSVGAYREMDSAPGVGRDGPVTSLWQERDPRCCRVLPAMPGAQPLSWELLPALQHSPHPSFCTWPAAVPWHEAPPTQNAVLAALRTPGRVYEQQGSALHCMEQQKSEPGPGSRAARQQLPGKQRVQWRRMVPVSMHNHSEQRGISKHGVGVFHQFRGVKDSRITAFLQPAGNGPGSVTKALCLQPVPHGSASTGFFSDSVQS